MQQHEEPNGGAAGLGGQKVEHSRPVRARGRLSLVIGTLVVALTFAALANADDVTNTLDASVDANFEAMALNVVGGTGSTTLVVVTRNGDGKNGCNLTGSTTLGVSVSSSDTGVATVSGSVPGRRVPRERRRGWSDELDECGGTDSEPVQRPYAASSPLSTVQHSLGANYFGMRLVCQPSAVESNHCLGLTASCCVWIAPVSQPVAAR